MSEIRSKVLREWLVKPIIELAEVKLNRKFFVVILAILLVGSILVGLSDMDISVADTGIPDNEMTSSVGKAGNSSASAVITITMYAVADE